MVNTVVLTLLVLAAVLLLLMVLAVAAVLRHRSSARMVLQEQANLRRQEELNERLKESKEAAEQALQIAEAANKAKSAFLGSISHDIRTPMNAIIRPQAKAKDQTFDIFVTPLNYELLQGDKLRINQILINLLSNSVKYTPAGGRIEMSVEELPQVMKTYSRVRFTVSDNGMGMSEDYLKVIFDPFTREQTEATYEIQGTGLGMAITKSLVDLMGGSIKVSSKLNEGSTFIVELELRIQEQEAMEIGIRHFMPKPFFISTFKNVVGRIMDDVNKKKEQKKNDDVVREAIESGMDAHIAKPVQIDTLKSTIQAGTGQPLGAAAGGTGDRRKRIKTKKESDRV